MITKKFFPRRKNNKNCIICDSKYFLTFRDFSVIDWVNGSSLLFKWKIYACWFGRFDEVCNMYELLSY